MRATTADLRVSLVRGEPALPWRCPPRSVRHDLPWQDVVATARAVTAPGAFLLSGGEPLRRGDLWELLTEVAQVRADQLGLYTAGHGLSTPIVERLRAAGLRRIQVPFHCARQDAHDWLVGETGALKTAHRAIRACVDADFPVAADIVLTRPTAAHLAETIEVLARSGVRTVCIRRLATADTDGPELIPLAARLSLIAVHIERAAAVALERRVRLTLRDLPLCAAPRLRPLFATAESELWVLADGSAAPRTEAGPGCMTCPGPPHCAGAPADYVARFGWEEFGDPAPVAMRMAEDVPGQQRGDATAPMVFTWRGPRRVRCEACGDAGHERAPVQQPYESTRVVRARMVAAARYRPARVRLVGADLLAHPQAAAMIHDAVRLFRHVEVAGEASAIVDWSDLDLRRIKELKRLDVALYGPDAATHDAHCGIPGAFAAVLRGVEHLRAKTSIAIGAYAILHDARAVPAYAEAWGRGTLPGSPRFRLSPKGSSLDELAECAAALPAGPARSALLALLPCCTAAAAADLSNHAAAALGEPTFLMQYGRSLAHRPGGSDPIGVFDTCDPNGAPCSVAHCPGIAAGWHSTARSQRWSGSSI